MLFFTCAEGVQFYCPSRTHPAIPYRTFFPFLDHCATTTAPILDKEWSASSTTIYVWYANQMPQFTFLTWRFFAELLLYSKYLITTMLARCLKKSIHFFFSNQSVVFKIGRCQKSSKSKISFTIPTIRHIHHCIQMFWK